MRSGGAPAKDPSEATAFCVRLVSASQGLREGGHMGQGSDGGIVAADRIEGTRPDDEGSIPFTRSIFKIKDLFGNIQGAECASKVLGVTSGVPDFELHPREQDYKAGRSTEEVILAIASAASTTNLLISGS
jgi:hypothetical protein